VSEADVSEKSVTVVIPFYGDFPDYLVKRAAASVHEQFISSTTKLSLWIDHEVKSLQEARNKPGLKVKTEWLIFLDADDELDPYYVEEMLAGEGDIRQPSTLGIVNGVEDDYSVLIPPKQPNFLAGNHIVIGAMIRTSLFKELGGFRDLPVLEDYDLWLRAWIAGADIQPCPKAIYGVHVNPNGRNNKDANTHGQVFQDLQRLYGPQARAKGLI
jgi:hypothetical protein